MLPRTIRCLAPLPPAFSLALSLVILVGCDPFVMYGPNDRQTRERTIIIIDGGTEHGAWRDPGTPMPKAPDTPDSQAPAPAPAPSPAPSPAPATGPAPSTAACGNALESAVFELVNGERAQNGVPPLACATGAGQVARDYSQRMCNEGFFSHTAPDGSTPWARLEAAGVHFMGAGENIAAGMPTAQDVMDAWMSSWGHRANILSREFTHLGVGHAPCGGQMGHYWTQNFLRR